MKTYSELTPEQQRIAKIIALNDLLSSIVKGETTFSGDVEDRIDDAVEKANKRQTPWLAAEYILEAARPELTGIAESRACNALYIEDHEIVIKGVL